MTKRDVNKIIALHRSGVSTDICYTAILQQVAPDLPRKTLNSAVEALTQFDDAKYAFTTDPEFILNLANSFNKKITITEVSL